MPTLLGLKIGETGLEFDPLVLSRIRFALNISFHILFPPITIYPVVICLMSALGLAYSIYPDIIIGQMTIFEAAAHSESLKFVLLGVVITLPCILGYTVFIYRVFAGKATSLSYD